MPRAGMPAANSFVRPMMCFSLFTVARRNRPQVQLPAEITVIAGVHRELLLWFPVAHIEGVRDYARARAELLQQLGTKPRVHARQQKQCHYAGLADIGLEQ